jgi:hypothetical protein
VKAGKAHGRLRNVIVLEREDVPFFLLELWES